MSTITTPKQTPRHTPHPSITTMPANPQAPIPLPSAGLPKPLVLPAAPKPSWGTMPHKIQLLVLFLSRFADFFQMACLQAIMFHQLRSFDSEASEPTISWQSGILTGVFTSAQIVTGLMWGRIADFPNVGRKKVLMTGFFGTAISCVGVAFSKSFGAAVAWRCLGGAVNGTVGSARTMLAESVPKPWHSRAFLILPLAFNVAQIFGPILGGAMADPVELYPQYFGPGSLFGGQDGVSWMKTFPYAAPNLLSALVCTIEGLLIWIVAFETLDSRKYMRDSGREIGRSIATFFGKLIFRHQGYSRLDAEIETPEDIEMTITKEAAVSPPVLRQVLPFSRIWTKNVLFTLLSIALFDFHMG